MSVLSPYNNVPYVSKWQPSNSLIATASTFPFNSYDNNRRMLRHTKQSTSGKKGSNLCDFYQINAVGFNCWINGTQIHKQHRHTHKRHLKKDGTHPQTHIHIPNGLCAVCKKGIKRGKKMPMPAGRCCQTVQLI